MLIGFWIILAGFGRRIRVIRPFASDTPALLPLAAHDDPRVVVVRGRGKGPQKIPAPSSAEDLDKFPRNSTFANQ